MPCCVCSWRRNTNLNSLWSICYCLIVLGVQLYTTYTSLSRYVVNKTRTWGSNGEYPSQLGVHVTFVSLSLLSIPFFVISSVFRVGNYANDGVKFGRDHVLKADVDLMEKPARFRWLTTLWRHFPPISQTLHVVSAFFLLLPEVLESGLEVKHGYLPTVHSWSTDLDFLYTPERLIIDDLRGRGTVNITTPINNTVAIETSGSFTVAYANFAASLISFSIRYPALFWYTNKVLSCLFAAQLFSMTLDALFAFSGMTVLYKVGLMRSVYRSLPLALGPITVVILYCIGGIILLFSCLTFFEYSFHFFYEKFKIIEERHQPALLKKAIIIRGTCHGYVPHSCAMVSLVLLAIFKGPIIYDLVQLYRHTQDQLVLTCVIVDVFYMLLWLLLWCGLTVKQEWQFRILDYMTMDNPVFTIQNHNINHRLVAPLEVDYGPGVRRKKKKVPTATLR